jgi:hypothetical protein
MSSPARKERDPRIDVLRGAALLMIFFDHMPRDVLNTVTMHNFGFSDAAEVFVLLAGVSSMLAYGKVFDSRGASEGLLKVGKRVLYIYLAQMLLLFVTLVVVRAWGVYFGLEPTVMAPMLLPGGAKQVASGVILLSLPGYLDILPLYVVLLALFPLIYLGLNRAPWLTVLASAGLWGATSFLPWINLPNRFDPNSGTWYFDPFSWQFLFVLGAVLSRVLRRYDFILPRPRWLVWLASAFLVFGVLQNFPWIDWGLPHLRPLIMAPMDKTHLAPIRLAHIAALMFLLLSSQRVMGIARRPWLRPLDACGRHSLETFSLLTLVALGGRLIYRTWGDDWFIQVTVNIVGVALICGVALLLERRKTAAAPRSLDNPSTDAQAFPAGARLAE